VAHGGRVASPAARAAHQAKIVVVDDVAGVREALAALLRGAGHEVAAYSNGGDALAALEREGADLVLTDLYMPNMTGWELVRALRARALTTARGLPLCIGLYSAVLSAFTREQLARAQVDFAITKLTDPEAILDAIERALAWSGSR
jgi:CheY-like chemotaxis protein